MKWRVLIILIGTGKCTGPTALSRVSKIRQNIRQGGGGGFWQCYFSHQRISQRLYGTPTRSNWTLEVQLRLEGIRTRISKETYSQLGFQLGRSQDPPL